MVIKKSTPYQQGELRFAFFTSTNMVHKVFFICFLIGSVMQGYGQDDRVLGLWKTIDDNTGEAKSIVEIYTQNDKVYGKIVAILNPDDRDKTCIYCEGDEKGQPLIGLDIIKNMQWDDDRYEDGTIFDPEKGKTYNAKLWVDEQDADVLKVRGYIAFLFRTQEWQRHK